MAVCRQVERSEGFITWKEYVVEPIRVDGIAVYYKAAKCVTDPVTGLETLRPAMNSDKHVYNVGETYTLPPRRNSGVVHARVPRLR
jgi:hypothetical protein